MGQAGTRRFGDDRLGEYDFQGEEEHFQVPRGTRRHCLLRLVDGLHGLCDQERLLERVVRPLRTVNKDFEYAEGDFPGDALMAIEKAIERLGDGKYRNLDDSTVLLLIKHLVHFLPDMHCPAHVIYNYRPSNYWVEINGRKELFHSVWDNMPSYGPHAWSVSEWCRYLGHCTKEERAEMVEGTPREWVADNARNCIVAYDIVRPDENVSDPDRYRGQSAGRAAIAERRLPPGSCAELDFRPLAFGRSVPSFLRRKI